MNLLRVLPAALLSLTLMGQGCLSYVRTDVNLMPPATPEEIERNTPPLTVVPNAFVFNHTIGKTECPTEIGDVNFILNEATKKNGSIKSWKANNPQSAMWLNFNKSGVITDKLSLSFNCKLKSYTTQTVETKVEIRFYGDDQEKPVATETINVKGNIVKP